MRRSRSTVLELIAVVLLALATGPGPVAPAAARAADAPPPAETRRLEPPRNLAVARYAPDVVIRWHHSGRGITGFQVERATGVGSFTRVGTLGRTARAFRDRRTRPGVAYVYRVRAVAAGTLSGDAVSPHAEIVVTVGRRARR